MIIPISWLLGSGLGQNFEVKVFALPVLILASIQNLISNSMPNSMAFQRNVMKSVLQAFLFNQEFLFFCLPIFAILFIFSLFWGNLAHVPAFFQTVTCNPVKCTISWINPWIHRLFIFVLYDNFKVANIVSIVTNLDLMSTLFW